MRWLFPLFLLTTITMPVPASSLPRSTPEEQGVSSRKLLAFVEAADERIHDMHSLMVVRHGHVVAEGWWAPYDARTPHALYSLSKSFTSTAVGLAIAEEKLRVDDTVLKYYGDDAPDSPSENLKSMRVSDLLRMSTGQQTEPPRPPDRKWTEAFLAHPVPFKPGTHFLYNTSGTYMLSAIVQKATGENLLDYLTPRLFQPLGIEKATWERSPQGIATGGYGLSLRTEDIAKYGQLYLQRGMWQGKRLVPSAWVDASTTLQTSNGSDPRSDWNQGYGYQFWRARHGAYRGDGAFGQYCIVHPGLDAVIVITSAVKDMQSVLDLVWDRLLPAFAGETLAPNPAEAEALHQKLTRLTLPTVTTTATEAHTGKIYAFPKNDLQLESIEVASSQDGTTSIHMKMNGASQTIAAASGAWKRGRMSWGRIANDLPVAATAGWTGPDQLTLKACFVETPFLVTIQMTFAADKLTLESEPNVGFGPTRRTTLVGTPAR